ncbi:MAG: hypothetical protein ABSF63_12905 [Candidatus Bathyarchaeia archaeon]|jgi:hypothetical protein
MVKRIVKKAHSSLIRNRCRYLSTIPKKLVRFMELDDHINYGLQWTLWNDKTVTVKFLPKV